MTVPEAFHFLNRKLEKRGELFKDLWGEGGDSQDGGDYEDGVHIS